MKYLKTANLAAFILFLIMFSFSACKNSDSLVQPEEQITSDSQVLQKLVENDESFQSFEPNYNEDQAMDLFGNSLSKTIYPLRVGQRMKLIEKNLDVIFEGDTAVGVLTRTFEGVLLIAASFDQFEIAEGVRPDSSLIDTVVQKKFTAVVIQNLKFVKYRNTKNPERNWKIAAISLPEGSTGSSNISITSMKIDMPNGETIQIDNPNDYYLERFPGFRRQIPVLNKGEEVTVTLQILSTYADEDLVTLTHGAMKGGVHHRVKRQFELVNEVLDGQYYKRTYQQTFIMNNISGYKHAIVNVIPFQVINDDATEVEEHSWGIPYIVR
ncbi:MAG: hypothetical protein KKB34_14765 [Bacteroidetes bacterium]|nr:hypothetical protein [Bacteroidota bacterium]